MILFREEHSPRVLVDKVDYVSAPGTSEGVARSGGPHALLTGMALFSFDPARKRFALRSVHRGATAAEVRASTGFDYDEPAEPPQTRRPTRKPSPCCAAASRRNSRRPIRNLRKSCAARRRRRSGRGLIHERSDRRVRGECLQYGDGFRERDPVDDAMARRFGFRGGLVPGVEVFAYMAHMPVARWGRNWPRARTSGVSLPEAGDTAPWRA